MWARKDHAHNGPPDNYQDYWDFVSAFVTRYRTGSAIGRVHAIEVWNEANLDREWGNQTDQRRIRPPTTCACSAARTGLPTRPTRTSW